MFAARPKPSDDVEELNKEFNSNKNSLFSSSPLSTVKKTNNEPQKKSNNVLKTGFENGEKNPSSVILLQEKIVEKNFSCSSSPFVFTPKLTSESFPKVFRAKSLKSVEGKSIFASSFSHNISNNTSNTIDNLSTKVVLDDKVRREIHEENLLKLKALSFEEIESEKRELESKLNPSLLLFLKNKSTQSKKLSVSKSNATMDPYIDLEVKKRQWMSEIPSEPNVSSTFPQARFDFMGFLILHEEKISVTLGLHHHGDEPHRPGYTIEELLLYARSSFDQQRVLAFETLGHLLNNYHNGIFDGVFDVHLLSELLKSGLVSLLRLGVDDKKESVIGASLSTLSSLLCNSFDENYLDRIAGHKYGVIQPSLSTLVSTPGTKEYSQFKKEYSELTDEQILSLDVIVSLLRMDILDRVSYILDTFRFGSKVVINILRLLLRISRHSLESARLIVFHPRLLKIVISHFLPFKGSTGDSKTLYGSPQPLALKILRILISWSVEIGETILTKYDLMESFFHGYAILEPVFSQGKQTIQKQSSLLLIIEAYRIWNVYLRYNYGQNTFRDIYPLFLKQFLYGLSSLQLSEINSNQGINNYDAEFGVAFLQVIQSASLLCLSKTSNSLDFSLFFPQFLSQFEDLTLKWLHNILVEEKGIKIEYQENALNLMGASLRSLSTLYFVYSRSSSFVSSVFLEGYSVVFERLNELIQSSYVVSLISSLLVDKDKKTREELKSEREFRGTSNLPSLDSVPYGGVSDSSSFRFITSTSTSIYNLLNSILTFNLMSISLPNGEEGKRTFEFASLPLDSLLLSSSLSLSSKNTLSKWFDRNKVETLALFVLLKSRKEKLGNEIPFLSLINSLFKGQEYLGKKLFQLYFKSLEQRQNNNNCISMIEIEKTYKCLLFPSLQTHLDSENILVETLSSSSYTCTNPGERLFPVDWMYLPLLLLLEKDSESRSEAEVLQVTHVLELVQLVTQNHLCNEDFVRLLSIFTLGPYLFLNSGIQSKLSFILKSMNVKTLSLNDREIGGLSSFYDFYSEVLQEFVSVSYGNSIFASFLLIPLLFDVKYSLCLWNEHGEALRYITLKTTDLPFIFDESQFQTWKETPSLLRAMSSAITNGKISKDINECLFSIATQTLRSHFDSYPKSPLKSEIPFLTLSMIS